MLAGAPFAHEIDFGTGLPTGAVAYSVLGNDGTPIITDSITPDPDAVSMLIVVPGTANTVSTPLFEIRTLQWSYTTTTGVVIGSVQYRIDKVLPFPASPDGVRAKLGVDDNELSDQRIDMTLAYANLLALYNTGALLPYEGSGDRTSLVIANAIEASAALALLPTLQLGVAKKEDSGTNSYERFSAIDWDMLRGSLEGYIASLNDIVTPIVDPNDYSLIFFAVQRTDPLTGNDGSGTTA